MPKAKRGASPGGIAKTVSLPGKRPTRLQVMTWALVLEQRLVEYITVLRDEPENEKKRHALWLAFLMAQHRLTRFEDDAGSRS